MKTLDQQTWWIIGASDGLGAALSQSLNTRGARLILSARNAERLKQVAAPCDQAHIIPLDVTDSTAVKWACDGMGPLDGIIYCAGRYEPMPATDWVPDLAEQMTDTNYTGALRVLSHIVPQMIERGSGRILLIGSLAGHRGLPGAIGYSASKAALMHLGENLALDLKGTGVRVQVSNPGFIRTRLTAKNDFAMPQLMSPEEAAKHVMKHLESRRFSRSFPFPFAWLFTLGRLLPFGLFRQMMR